MVDADPHGPRDKDEFVDLELSFRGFAARHFCAVPGAISRQFHEAAGEVGGGHAESFALGSDA
ncbi:hypothetical protein GJR88_01884 [Dietzia sp. DQ12-45-1b]|nr:hypothetical protein GJR88_01884 [Dietzia sp. DQ12-45-1b]